MVIFHGKMLVHQRVIQSTFAIDLFRMEKLDQWLPVILKKRPASLQVDLCGIQMQELESKSHNCNNCRSIQKIQVVNRTCSRNFFHAKKSEKWFFSGIQVSVAVRKHDMTCRSGRHATKRQSQGSGLRLASPSFAHGMVR